MVIPLRQINDPNGNFKKANWANFRTQCKQEIIEDVLQTEGDEMKALSEKLLEIATDNIPMTSPFHNKKNKPWFDEDCRAAKRERNRANRLNRRYPCLDNTIKVKVATAQAKRTFKKKKKESWRKYVSSINSRTPSKKVWNMVRKITGKNIPSHLLHLKDATGKLITDKEDIASTIGATFEKNSSSVNYSDDFQSVKRSEEGKPLNFKTNDRSLPYNKRFKLRDLKRSIKKSNDSTPGPDNIHYRILKNLPDETLKIILNIINRHWEQHTFPESWREALLLPIPKPGKDHQNPNNFRPIALTSCICKTVERMVNERLIHYLEENKILTKFQAGFRFERSTLDQLVRLDSFIRDAFNNNEHVVGVFFDLSKAYDTTWRYGIMRDLHKMGLRGNLPIFIQHFLTERTFQILLGTTLYPETFIQEEGVPQGAILSTTLFDIKLNDIVSVLSKDVHCSLYVDDFKIYYRSPTVEGIERQLQMNINSILRWTKENGFTVSYDKTVAMHFCKLPESRCVDPVLRLGGKNIKFVKEHKFLGLIWDSKLSFKSHVTYLKKKCNQALNLIRVLSYSNWGSDTKTLLKLFRSLVRSKMDYGSIVYMSADKDDLKPLDVIHRHGIRLCLGAFKTTRIESLYAQAYEPPLDLRRKELAMRYALKIKSNPDNAAYNCIFNQNEFDYECIASSIRTLFREANIDHKKIMTSRIPQNPIWRSEPNDVSFVLTAHDKQSTSREFFQSRFFEILPFYSEYLHIYTDGSKQENRAASGLIYGGLPASYRIKNNSSIFTAELHAIKRALDHIRISPRLNNKFVIFSDSKSALESIDNQESRNPLVVDILDYLQYLKSKGKIIKFCWIPSHVGIIGNERADAEARTGLTLDEPVYLKLPHQDYIPVVKSYIMNKWQQKWNQTKDDRLGEIMPVLSRFHTTSLNRKEETVINRIRIGHTRLTQSYKMEDPNKVRPLCPFCNLEDITVKHIMITCNYFRVIRSNHYSVNSMRDLFDRVSFSTIISFLKEARLFHLI